MFYEILATGKKSQTVQQCFTTSNNPLNPDLNKVNDINTTDNIPKKGNSSSNLDGPPNIATTQPTPKKTRNICRDEPPPQYAKVIGGHILAQSIIAVVEKMQANCKDKQKAIEMRKKLEAIAVLELAKT